MVLRRIYESKELQTSNVKNDLKRIAGFIFKVHPFQL